MTSKQLAMPTGAQRSPDVRRLPSRAKWKARDRILLAIVLTLFAWGLAFADDTTPRVESKSRDRSAAFVATQNFIVGRLGRDCLKEVGRPETPLEYQQSWQRENARYFAAANKYMAARLAEIADPEERDRVQHAYYAAAQKSGELATKQLYGQGRTSEVCKYALTIVDAGNMNIDEFGKVTKLPIMKDLEELVAWAESSHEEGNAPSPPKQ
jgi:hypothetical protein